MFSFRPRRFAFSDGTFPRALTKGLDWLYQET